LLASLGDIYGRLPVIRISLINALFCYIMLIFFSDRLGLIYIVYFVFGITSTFRMGAGFLYSMEIIESHNQNMAGSIINFFDAIHVIIMSLYFLFVSQDWIYIHLFYTALILLATVMSFFLPEAPAYLL
jgi:hypothetical protein